MDFIIVFEVDFVYGGTSGPLYQIPFRSGNEDVWWWKGIFCGQCEVKSVFS